MVRTKARPKRHRAYQDPGRNVRRRPGNDKSIATTNNRSTYAASAVNRPGFAVGTATAKKVLMLKNLDNCLPYTVNTQTISDIPKGDLINERERDIANVAGWTLRFHVHNQWQPHMMMRYAVVSPRQTWDVSTPATASVDFLRSYTTNRTQNVDVSSSGIAQATNPIDTDFFMVLSKGELELGPGYNTYTGGEIPNWKTLHKWVPLNKQLRWNADGEVGETPVYFCYWFDCVERKGGETMTALAGAAGTLQTRFQATCYFHEPGP